MKILKNYVNGEWRDSRSGEKKTLFNPANRQESISQAPASNVVDVEEAIAAATRAFPSWSQVPAPQRAALLENTVRLMEARGEDFALAITLENGKTLREARTELRAALKEAAYQISFGRRLGGRHVPSEQPDVVCYLERCPLGVASLITPWNFPLNVACRKMFPALIAGNACVLKPSELTPGTTALLFEVMAEAGFPAGAVSFTGSTEVGVRIARACAGSATRLQLEMGGKNPLVVLADADLEKAVEAAMIGAFSCSGQWCTSTSRVIVEAPLYPSFLDNLVRKAGELVVGDGRDPQTDMGPVAGEKQYETILKYIDIGKREGARVCLGGHPLCEGSLSQGWFIAPTIFADVTPQMQIAREEIFGPVVSVLKAKDFDEALSMANDTVYGLASSIYTNDLGNARRFVQKSEVGLCHVNMPTAWKEPQLEFGGIKESGRGLPEAGESGTEFFTTHKAIYIHQNG
jgi:acyl-CoA reductase-like NAD-dependent aldehyde dehydrogenase